MRQLVPGRSRGAELPFGALDLGWDSRIGRAPARRRVRVWATVSHARLILTCGLPGAGKTTLARQLAADRSALLAIIESRGWRSTILAVMGVGSS